MKKVFRPVLCAVLCLLLAVSLPGCSFLYQEEEESSLPAPTPQTTPAPTPEPTPSPSPTPQPETDEVNLLTGVPGLSEGSGGQAARGGDGE